MVCILPLLVVAIPLVICPVLLICPCLDLPVVSLLFRAKKSDIQLNALLLTSSKQSSKAFGLADNQRRQQARVVSATWTSCIYTLLLTIASHAAFYYYLFPLHCMLQFTPIIISINNTFYHCTYLYIVHVRSVIKALLLQLSNIHRTWKETFISATPPPPRVFFICFMCASIIYGENCNFKTTPPSHHLKQINKKP